MTDIELQRAPFALPGVPQGLYAAFAAQKDRLFLWSPVVFALGIALYFSLDFEPSLAAGAVPVVLAAALLALGRGRRAVAVACGGLLLFCLGFLAAEIRTRIVATPVLAEEMSPVWVEGTVAHIDMLEPGEGSRIVLRDVAIEDVAAEDTPRKIRIRLRRDENVVAGQRVRVLAGLNPPSPPVEPGAFDFQRFLFFKGIGAVGFAYKAPEILAERAASGPGVMLEHLRAGIAERAYAALSPAFAPFGVALLTGQQSAVAEEDREALRDSGLAHLLAISGMNIAMIFGTVLFFARLGMAAIPPLALHRPIKKYAAAGAFLVAVLYTLVVGADVPVLRALLMTGIVTLAIFIDRSPFSLRLMAFAALVLLILAPENLVNVSFQLSFAAVAALIFFYEWSRPFWLLAYARAGIARRALFYLAGVLITSVIAAAATAPVILYHFQNFPVYGVLANMIGVPVMGFVVMPAAVMVYALMPLGLEGPALAVMDWGIGWIMATARWAAGMEESVWHVRAWPPAAFGLLMAGAVFAMLWKGPARTAGIVAAIIGLALIPLHRAPDILVSEDAKLIAVRGSEGALHLSTLRAEKFTAEQWMQRDGREGDKAARWPDEGRADGFPLMCDSQGCRGEMQGHKLSVVRAAPAIAEECAWADILIAQIPVREYRCAAPVVIDRFDARDAGAYAIFLTPDKMKVESVAQWRGLRPWTGPTEPPNID